MNRHWSLELALLRVVLAVGIATLPDVNSHVPRIRHRGITHTIWFAALVGLFVGIGTTIFAPSMPRAFSFGVVVGACGVLAHLAGDVVTPMGISRSARSGGDMSR